MTFSREQIGVVIQARMNSRRLFGKVLKAIGPCSMLEHVVMRASRSELAGSVCVATSAGRADDPVAELAGRLGARLVRGDEEDVLSRYLEAASRWGYEVMVRVTGDCPLLDHRVIDEALGIFASGSFDHVSNIIRRTYPRGMDMEVFSSRALSEAAALVRHKYEREHVTPYILEHPERFRLGHVLSGGDGSQYRLTVDTEDDLKLVTKVYQEAVLRHGDDYGYRELVKILKDHPEWALLNAHIRQKAIK